jgi:hypothetical protein
MGYRKKFYKGYELGADWKFGCYIKAPGGEMIFDTCALDEVASTPWAAIAWMKTRVDGQEQNIRGNDDERI